jgi:hypothetical protein
VLNYNVAVHLNENFPNAPYNSFFRYHWKQHVMNTQSSLLQ